MKPATVPFRKLLERQRLRQEAERARVALRLHDELGQTLTVLRMNATWILANLANVSQDVKECLESSLASGDNAIRAIRSLSNELRPGILDLGIVAAIEWQTEEFENRTHIECAMDLTEEDDLMDAATSLEMFRMFQEILSNVRHSAATKVNVTLRTQGEVLLEVRDNGRGITEEQVTSDSSLGLWEMRERAAVIGGQFSIAGEADRGTVVTIRIPGAS